MLQWQCIRQPQIRPWRTAFSRGANCCRCLTQVCELDENGVCKPGTKYGTKLVTQEAKPQNGKEDEEESIE